MTIGIDTLSSGHKASEYKFWDIEKYTSPTLTETVGYYLYVKDAPGINDETDLLGFPTPALRGRSVPRGHRPLFLPHGWPDARRPGFRLGVGRFAASQ